MNPSTGTPETPRPRIEIEGRRAAARVPALLIIVFLLGLGAGALWFSHNAHRRAERTPGPPPVLSPATRAVLARLDKPVEIRFYALLDPATTPDSLKAFADRASGLLSEFQREGGDKIAVTRQTTPSDAAANLAAADGITPFNLEKGAACFLGIAVIQGGQRESIPRLSPDWETALEPDLSRAIDRLIAPPPAAPVNAETAAIQATAEEEVRRAIPNLDTVTPEAATETLRRAALADFKAAAGERERALKEAEQLVLEAQNKTEADQQAALKRLQQVQAEHTEKLQAIAARLQNQLEALQRLKSGATP
jgi:hypothetical protein